MSEKCIVCGTSVFRKKRDIGEASLMECRECGLQFIDPLPGQDFLDALYEDYYHMWGMDRAGAQVPEMKKNTFRGYLERVSAHTSRGALLDVGCATGELMTVAGEMGFEVHGVEVSPDGVQRCRELFGMERILGARLMKGDFTEHFFDVITLSDVLEHIPDPLDFMDTLWRMLKPDGYVMIVTPDTSSWTRKMSGGYWPHYKKDHLYYFNRSNLAKMVSERFDVVVSERACKMMTLDYMSCVLQGYHKHGLLHIVGRFLDRLPARWKARQFTVHIGEMFVLLRRRA